MTEMQQEKKLTLEKSLLLTRCWLCDEEMELKTHTLKWECACGFHLHENTCVALHHDFDSITIVGTHALGKRKNKRGFHVLRMHKPERSTP